MLGAPWAVAAFVILQLQIPIHAIRGDTFNENVVTTLLLFAGLMVFLWRGSRVAWSFLFAFEAFAVLVQPFDPAPWWAWALNLAGLILLLWPSTRQHVWGWRKRRERAAA